MLHEVKFLQQAFKLIKEKIYEMVFGQQYI
jgi:hypothetical protein